MTWPVERKLTYAGRSVHGCHVRELPWVWKVARYTDERRLLRLRRRPEAQLDSSRASASSTREMREIRKARPVGCELDLWTEMTRQRCDLKRCRVGCQTFDSLHTNDVAPLWFLSLSVWCPSSKMALITMCCSCRLRLSKAFSVSSDLKKDMETHTSPRVLTRLISRV